MNVQIRFKEIGKLITDTVECEYIENRIFDDANKEIYFDSKQWDKLCYLFSIDNVYVKLPNQKRWRRIIKRQDGFISRDNKLYIVLLTK